MSESAEAEPLDLGLDQEVAAGDADDLDFGDFDMGDSGLGDGLDEIGTKLDLATAYVEMGDSDGAREMLEEVMSEGDAAQKSKAEQLLEQIAAQA